MLLHSLGIIAKCSNACDIQLSPLFKKILLTKKIVLNPLLNKKLSDVTSHQTFTSFISKEFISYQTKCMQVFREKIRYVITMSTTSGDVRGAHKNSYTDRIWEEL